MTKHVSKLLGIASLLVLALVILALMPLFSSPYADAQPEGLTSETVVPATPVVPENQAQLDLSFAPLVRQASPAVVNVFTKRVVQQQQLPWPFSDSRMRGRAGDRVQNSLGSGVIVGADGVIITNNHVIKGADEFRVVLSDRREYEAELVLADERTDLAVLKIDTEGEVLPILPFADTRDVEVGDLVLAIGNPFGVGQTVTSGIISATARTDVGISDFAFFLQTDAAINPGNSGGALVDNRGQLVGVNTAIFSRSGGSNGIGFAIPAEMVKRVVDAGINEGRIVRPWLGLKGQAVSYDIAKSQGLARPVGVIITDVFEGAPADQAGLRRGDLVVAIDGREVFDDRGLKFLAATQLPGDVVTLDVLRAGQPSLFEVELAPPPGTTEAELILLEGLHPLSGAEVALLSPALAEEMGRDIFRDEGILVTRILRRSLARRSGIRSGDIILNVNGKNIRSLEELDAALSSGARDWTYTVQRNGRELTGRTRI